MAAAAEAAPAFETAVLRRPDGVDIAYVDAQPDGHDDGAAAAPPVLLVHGYAGSAAANWLGPGLLEGLRAGGRRVIAVDLRGHGGSSKPASAAAYAHHKMHADVLAVLRQLGVREVDVVGYSMGCSFALWLALVGGGVLPALDDAPPPKCRRLVIAGHGDGLTGWGAEADEVAAGLRAESDDGLTAKQLGYRAFVAATKGDAAALAAVAEAWRDRGIAEEHWSGATMPTLLLVGADDADVSLDRISVALPDCRVERPPGDHLSVVAEPAFREALLRFLSEVPSG